MRSPSFPTIALALAAAIGAAGLAAHTPSTRNAPVQVAQMGATPMPVPSIPASPMPSPTGTGM